MLTDLKEEEYSQFSGRTKHLMKYFLCKLRNYFSTIHGFYQSRADPSFWDAQGQKVFGWEWAASERPMPYYIICDGLTTTTALLWQAVEQNMWNELHLLIRSIYNALWKLISLAISKSIFSSSPVYLFYLSPLCCAEAVSGLHLYIATLLLLLRGNVLIQGYNVFTSTQMI